MIADSVLDLVGKTPMVKLRRMASGMADVLLKLESHNPAGSVKDRACLSMIEAAERDGKLKPGDTIVEATSGNTGLPSRPTRNRMSGMKTGMSFASAIV